MIEKDIDNIVWWIPFKKLRNSIRNYLLEIKNINIKLENVENNINNKYLVLYNKIKKTTPKTNIDFIEIHLAEHCNLNCYSCSHFSQLAKEKYYDIDIFKNDIERLYELTNGIINRFHLMGGEPLLNKNCKDYFYIVRKYFKNSSIWLVTNGILLPKQDESFWLSCQKNNIEIHPTKYPINIDWEKIKQLCYHYNIPLIFYNNENVEKESRKNVIDLYGKMDSFDNFLNCGLATNCIALNNGKIFPCGISSNIWHFNEYFNKHLEITEYDYIDIYKTNNYKEILEFLSKPIPFCRYCNITKWHGIGKWETSKRNIEEYTDQTRPDQTRPDQTRPDHELICQDYICFYNNLKYKKLQPMYEFKEIA
ncbi:radical SAM protein [Brachyspira pulli]|uniref:radical SAM protein n=2 Tax=Brachyspira pulli TaxID=310721 RepID=UPI00300723C3